MITSKTNPQVKEIKKLLTSSKHRNEEGLFVVEGARMVEEIPNELLKQVYVTEGFMKRRKDIAGETLLEILKGENVEVITEEVYKAITDTVTPQGIMAVVKQPEYNLEKIIEGVTIFADEGDLNMLLKKTSNDLQKIQKKTSGAEFVAGENNNQVASEGDLKNERELQTVCVGSSRIIKRKTSNDLQTEPEIQAVCVGDSKIVCKGNSQNVNKKACDSVKFVILDDIRDPGNLGTIVRTAEAAGVSGLVLSPGCVDIFNPKVIRSTMGSIFRVPFVITELDKAIYELKKRGANIFGAALDASVSYKDVKYGKINAFVIGNEARGISEKVLSMTDRNIRIPMHGQVESLNAAISLAVLLFR